MFDFHDGLDTSHSRELDAQLDATYNQSDTGFFRSWQMGSRFTYRKTSRFDGYRDAFPGNYGGDVLSNFPTSDQLTTTTLNFAGLDSTFYHLDGASILNNMSDIRSYIQANSCAVSSASNCIQTSHYDWSTDKPTDVDKTNSYNDAEKSFAVYAQMNFGFTWKFPVDGTVGVRGVSTWGHSYSTRVTYDPSYNATYTTIPGGGHYTDVLPNLSATMHFTPKLQLRLSYAKDVQRPSFYDLSPWVVADANAKTNVYEGNPDLQPNHITNYDASLEYYYGRGGVASFAAFVKKPTATFFYSGVQVPSYVWSDGTTSSAYVYQTRNAGPGTFQGYEFNVSSFFDFLPGVWHNFGASANYTYYQVYKIEYPDGALGANYSGSMDASYTSKDTYNVQFYYDTPKLGARIAYNYRSSYRADPYLAQPDLTIINRATSRLDASIDWTPVKQWTFSIEGTNLLNNNATSYWGTAALPAEVRLQAQTIIVGARFRY
jgi:iron complex outermembrane receptor protein